MLGKAGAVHSVNARASVSVDARVHVRARARALEDEKHERAHADDF